MGRGLEHLDFHIARQEAALPAPPEEGRDDSG